VLGLRREEVARLACISTDYYTRLEQAKVAPPSEAVLIALVGALCLDEAQERYLRAIAGRDGPSRRVHLSPDAAAEELLVLLGHLDDVPALVLSRCLDILAWNGLAAALFTDFSALPATERNIVLLTYCHDEVRSRFKDWPSAARTGASLLRMTSAAAPDDPRLAQIVHELSSRAPEFRRWWSAQRVASGSRGLRTYVHPLAGEFQLYWLILGSSAHLDEFLMVLMPEPGGAGAEALERLAR
jgi:transcriptional regulator with XRE-family HTH domain